MNENKEPEIPSHYNNPELLAQAGGDRQYLDRLVALQNAIDLLAKNPDNPSFEQLVAIMQQTVDEYRESKGIEPPDVK